MEICSQCWLKLSDFNEFYEHVAKVHNLQTKCVLDNVIEDVDKREDQNNWKSSIKTEALEEALDNNVDLHFFEADDDIFAENPLLEFVSEEDNDVGDIVAKDVKTKRVKSKTPKTPKTRKSKKTAKRSKSPVSSDNDEENDRAISSLLDDIKNEESDESFDLNLEIKNSLNKKRKPKRNANKTDDKATPDKPHEPKKRKGHVLLEENEGLIKKHIKMLCQMCSYIGEDFSCLIKHYKEEHAGVKPYIKCCERKLDCPSDILQHAYYHEDPEHFKCSECGKTFINNSGLKDHFMKHHEPEENLPYGCDECPRRFSRKNLLAHHKAKHIPKTERSHFCEICQPAKA